MTTRNQSEKDLLLRLRDIWEEAVAFRVTVVDEGNCRANHRVGQEFEFSWRSPEGICTESLIGMYPILHSMRALGDMRELGSSKRNVKVYSCPSQEIKFRIEALYRCNICGNKLQFDHDGVQSPQLQCTRPEFPLRVCDTCYTNYKDRRIEW
ncbi:MAG: TIGR04076 family protein [Candidatus Thorarchaeota archaeon]|nr:TIGR04076 family protein [Candidatus Thorarchaeota archaeon]